MKKVMQCFKFKENYCLMFAFILIIAIIVIIIIFFGDYLNKYSEGIIALSAILGVIFGSSWLDVSKNKMRGKLDYDIARKYLKAVLELRDAIKIVRNPFIPIGEIQKALEKNGFNANDYEDQEKMNRSVYSMRLNKLQKSWTSLNEVLLDAEVSWGNEAIEVQKGLDDLVRELRSVVWLFINSKESFYKKDDNEKILYGTHDENDEFAKNINIEIKKIRIFLKKHL